MGQEDDIPHLEQLFGHMRLIVEDIQTGCDDCLGFQGSDESRFINRGSPPDVDQDAAWPQSFQDLEVDQRGSFRPSRSDDDLDIDLTGQG